MTDPHDDPAPRVRRFDPLAHAGALGARALTQARGALGAVLFATPAAHGEAGVDVGRGPYGGARQRPLRHRPDHRHAYVEVPYQGPVFEQADDGEDLFQAVAEVGLEGADGLGGADAGSRVGAIVQDRVARYGYSPAAENYGGLRCLLPHDHAADAGRDACVPVAEGVALRRYPDGRTALARLLVVARAGALAAPIAPLCPACRAADAARAEGGRGWRPCAACDAGAPLANRGAATTQAARVEAPAGEEDEAEVDVDAILRGEHEASDVDEGGDDVSGVGTIALGVVGLLVGYLVWGGYQVAKLVTIVRGLHDRGYDLVAPGMPLPEGGAVVSVDDPSFADTRFWVEQSDARFFDRLRAQRFRVVKVVPTATARKSVAPLGTSGATVTIEQRLTAPDVAGAVEAAAQRSPAHAVVRIADVPDYQGDSPDATLSHWGDAKGYGYWRGGGKRTAHLPDPRRLVDETWDPEERERVAAYLDDGEVLDTYRGTSKCRICGQPNGNQDLTDGVYRYPSGLSHYVRAHAVRVPDDLRARALGVADDDALSGAYEAFNLLVPGAGTAADLAADAKKKADAKRKAAAAKKKAAAAAAQRQHAHAVPRAKARRAAAAGAAPLAGDGTEAYDALPPDDDGVEGYRSEDPSRVQGGAPWAQGAGDARDGLGAVEGAWDEAGEEEGLGGVASDDTGRGTTRSHALLARGWARVEGMVAAEVDPLSPYRAAVGPLLEAWQAYEATGAWRADPASLAGQWDALKQADRLGQRTWRGDDAAHARAAQAGLGGSLVDRPRATAALQRAYDQIAAGWAQIGRWQAAASPLCPCRVEVTPLLLAWRAYEADPSKVLDVATLAAHRDALARALQLRRKYTARLADDPDWEGIHPPTLPGEAVAQEASDEEEALAGVGAGSARDASRLGPGPCDGVGACDADALAGYTEAVHGKVQELASAWGAMWDRPIVRRYQDRWRAFWDRWHAGRVDRLDEIDEAVYDANAAREGVLLEGTVDLDRPRPDGVGAVGVTDAEKARLQALSARVATHEATVHDAIQGPLGEEPEAKEYRARWDAYRAELKSAVEESDKTFGFLWASAVDALEGKYNILLNDWNLLGMKIQLRRQTAANKALEAAVQIKKEREEKGKDFAKPDVPETAAEKVTTTPKPTPPKDPGMDLLDRIKGAAKWTGIGAGAALVVATAVKVLAGGR